MSVEARVDRGLTTAHAAASVGSVIVRELGYETSALASSPLVSKFKRAVEQAGLAETLQSSRIEYAERLALSPGQLLYEEMHKLFSLCQEILALQSLGYEVDADLLERHVAVVSAKLHAESEVASLVAEDLELTTSHNFWRMSGIARPPVAGQ